MKLTLSRTLAAAALVGLAAFGSVAQARTAVSIGFSVPIGGYGYGYGYNGGYYGGYNAYVAPPVAYAPAPVYYSAPAYYAPAPVYYAPPRVVYRPRAWVRPVPVVGVRYRAW
ncbi:hypothetical protein WG902_14180 [Ramlibacter sp. PS3R-8]|uniref:hypothetical protein n=1 Tax=Ramlibacter sp. PS3R-8 TaxID=3133437 RepID=UPI00309626B0